MAGGKRPGAGRPFGSKSFAGKSESRATLERRLKELNRRGTEDAKKEACRLAIQLLPFCEPKLNAVAVQATTTVTYVARLPAPIKDIEEWQKQMVPLLTNQDPDQGQ
jgi:hypothetical protein